jgi:hypothetical protein
MKHFKSIGAGTGVAVLAAAGPAAAQATVDTTAVLAQVAAGGVALIAVALAVAGAVWGGRVVGWLRRA